MLMAQGQEPLETNQIAGGYVVPVSPLAGVAKVAQQLAGAYVNKQAEDKQLDLNQKKSEIVKALYSGETPPTLDKVAATGIASPETMLKMGSELQAAQAQHSDKMDERKLAAELTKAQREEDRQARAEQAQLAREQTFAQQKEMARLAASLRPEPQPRQDPLVQVQGQDNQPVYVPSSKAVGQRPFTQQTLKQEQAEAAKEQQKNQASLSAQQALDQAALLAEHPGRQNATGASSFLSRIPGTKAKDFQANLDTFKAQTFVPMVSALKGMGALSDAEGKKLSESVGALDQSMSEEGFLNSLKEVTNFLYQKAATAGLEVSLPDFAGGNINIDIKGELSPEDRAALEADIAKEAAKSGGLSPQEQAELEQLRKRFGR